MSDNTTKKNKDEKAFSLFKKITALPYLLVIFALLMPLANVSCSEDKVIAAPNVYELASGLDLEQSLKEPALGLLKKMEAGNPAAIEKFRVNMPNFPKLEPMPALYAILLGAFLAAVFAWISPLGSIAMGMLTMVAMGAFFMKITEILSNMGIPLLSVGTGLGYSAAVILIFIGTAMNLATIIRPIVIELKARRAQKKLKG